MTSKQVLRLMELDRNAPPKGHKDYEEQQKGS